MNPCSHGTADNFLLDTEGNKTWNIESLVTEVSSSSSCHCRLPPPSPQVCDIQVLVGKPKLFFIEACRGKENNFSTTLMSKASCMPQQCGITLPRCRKTLHETRLGRAGMGNAYIQLNCFFSLLHAHHENRDLDSKD